MTKRNQLSALTVGRLAKKQGLHNDGAGLCLRVKDGGCSWILRYMIRGRAHQLGLGRYPDISLAMARELAAKARTAKAGPGRDPQGAGLDLRAMH
jgi:hypothetical protein